MTIAAGRVTKEENDLFDIMDDRLRRVRFVFVGWSGLLLLCLFRFKGLVYRDYFCNFLVYPWIG
jgi:hypothetical protein